MKRPPATAEPDGARILLVEDSAVSRRLFSAVLEREGWSVVVAASGEEAVQLFAASRFHLVLLDVQLPDIDGFEVARAMRELEGDPASRGPILCLSADVDASVRAACEEAGMDGYLGKPVSPERLAAAVRARLAGSGPDGPGGERPTDSRGEAAGLDRALEMLGGDRELVGELVRGFVGEAPAKVRAIAEALEARDPEALARAAHALRSALAIFDAARAGRIVSELETRARQGDLTRAPELVAALEREIPRVCEALSRR
jgi:CheY-like chemotaxis protein/HPt (histidine-containing phosphotransfer) domain-containing protein